MSTLMSMRRLTNHLLMSLQCQHPVLAAQKVKQANDVMHELLAEKVMQANEFVHEHLADTSACID